MAFPLIPVLGALGGTIASGVGSYFANRKSNSSQRGAGGSQLQQLNQQMQPQQGQPQGSFWSGTPSSTQQISKLTPDQQQLLQGIQPQFLQLLQQLLQQGQQQQQPQNAFNFAPIEQQARTDFQQKTLPSIANYFAGMGGYGSSGFRSSVGEAGSGLDQALAALKSQYGLKQQALGQQFQLGQSGNQQALLGMLAQLLGGSRFDTAYHPAQPGFGQSIAPGLASGLGSGIAGALGKWALGG